jgi:hypothetical protein
VYPNLDSQRKHHYRDRQIGAPLPDIQAELARFTRLFSDSRLLPIRVEAELRAEAAA